MKRFQKVTEGDWNAYFKANRARRLTIDWAKGVTLEPDRAKALVASLQRFQIGESGEGHHLKSCAAATNDMEYCRAIDLFIAEENYHAEMLAKVLESQNALLLTGHWSDAAFVLIRRFSGLEMELMILLAAELLARQYYRVLRDSTVDENVRAMCRQILRDERQHVAFHCDTLSRSYARLSPLQRSAIRICWRAFYHFVCAVVALDHRGVLRAGRCSFRQWMRSTTAVFKLAERQIFEQKRTAKETTANIKISGVKAN
jgi:hypothetical protein